MKKLRSSLLTFAFLGLMTVVASAAEGGVKEKTLLDLFNEGGWVMYPITIASASTINQVLAFPPSIQPSPFPSMSNTHGGSSGGGGGSIGGGGGGGSMTHLVTAGQSRPTRRSGRRVSVICTTNPYPN